MCVLTFMKSILQFPSAIAKCKTYK